MLFGVSPKERAEETGISKSSLYAKANLFDQAGMASLLPPVPPPEIPKQDKRTLPPPMRQAIVDAKAEHPGLSLHEIARICYVQFNRRPSHHTIQLVLASGPKPSRTTRRFPRFDEMGDPAERRHEYWSCDVRYIEDHLLPDPRPVYVITIFENFSRMVLSSKISATQNQWDYLSVLADALRRYGAPEAIVTDGGTIFTCTQAMQLYDMLEIRKERIDPGEPWENYAETLLYVMWNLENSFHNLHATFEHNGDQRRCIIVSIIRG